jgi:hypothetical protein
MRHKRRHLSLYGSQPLPVAVGPLIQYAMYTASLCVSTLMRATLVRLLLQRKDSGGSNDAKTLLETVFLSSSYRMLYSFQI